MIRSIHLLTFLRAREPHEVQCERCGRGWPTIAAWAAEKTSECAGDGKLAGVVAALEGPEFLGTARRKELAEAVKGAIATGFCMLVLGALVLMSAGCQPLTEAKCGPRGDARVLVAWEDAP